MGEQDGGEPMDTHMIVIVVSISGPLVIVGFVLFLRRQATRRLNSSVDATITEIRVEASLFSSWWTVTAVWPYPQTGLTLIFRSPPIRFPPKHHIGEHITVNYEATNPKHYRMEL
jgi:hypothetical protein